MKAVKKAAAQGDVWFRRVTCVPKNAVKSKRSTEGYVVAHSETGHHHIASGAKAHYTVPDGMLAYLVMAKGRDIEVKHHREYDTHETLRLLYDSDSEGDVIWEIRRQREYVPDGWRRVED